jgi:hypothetical protein
MPKQMMELRDLISWSLARALRMNVHYIERVSMMIAEDWENDAPLARKRL